MTRIDRDTYELNTGRRIRTSSGVLGLRPDLVESWETRLTGGYDEFRFEGATKRPHGDSDNLLTPAERREIAEYQIKLWAEWAAVPMSRVVSFEYEPGQRVVICGLSDKAEEALGFPSMLPTTPDPPPSPVPDRFVEIERKS